MIEDAQATLNNFIHAMSGWELFYYHEVREKGMTSIREQMKKDLDEIFSNFCTLKERKQGRQVSLNCSDPPTYSPDEEILHNELLRNKAIFVTQQHTGFEEKYRYTLNFKSNEWRIDKKERFSSYENKWLKDNL